MPNHIQSKITRDALTKSERERLSKVEAAFRIHAASLHGDALSQLMVDTLCASLASDHGAIFHYVVTGNTEELDPNDTKAMRSLTRSVIESDAMAQRNLEFSLGARKAELEAEFLDSLPVGSALQLQRQGVLEQRKAQYVSEKLDARFA